MTQIIKPELWYSLLASRKSLADSIKSLEGELDKLDPIATMFVKADLGKLEGLLAFMDTELAKWEVE